MSGARGTADSVGVRPDPVNDELLRKAAGLPTTAGVYLFKDRRGRVIYVGKAINLRARVRQYVSLQDERFMVPHLVAAAADLDVVATDTEKEALLLENTLIKKHRPRYNTQLRDDKAFLHLRLDPKSAWPRWLLVRRIKDDGARYFGPFHSASKARETLAVLGRGFPLRTCSDATLASRSRPCILHQMHRCTAPCVGLVTAVDYREAVDESVLFLEGRKRPLVQRLAVKMRLLAEAERFEDAARVRDLVRSVEATLERQKVVDPKLGDRDVWGIFREGTRGALAVVPIREGMMGEPTVGLGSAMVGDDGELLSTALIDHYPSGADIPPEVLVPVRPNDADALEELLSERRGAKVEIRAPARGDKVRLVALAAENARLRFANEHDAEERLSRALADLAEVVGLPAPPHRIECFDNSNLQGTNPVAAMSVLIDGKPARGEYRRYRVKTVVGADDYATMGEIVRRRVRRGRDEGNLPDLLVVDGGRGQLNVALAVLKDEGVSLRVIGISKPRTEHARGEADATDKIVLPEAKDPIRLPSGNPALRLLQLVRDEVHAHAVRYHRQVRGRTALVSALEAIPGVGPTRRRALLTALGSARAVADADIDTIAAVPGIGPAMAEAIHLALNPDIAPPPIDDDEAL